jgi:hypothetical protein
MHIRNFLYQTLLPFCDLIFSKNRARFFNVFGTFHHCRSLNLVTRSQVRSVLRDPCSSGLYGPRGHSEPSRRPTSRSARSSGGSASKAKARRVFPGSWTSKVRSILTVLIVPLLRITKTQLKISRVTIILWANFQGTHSPRSLLLEVVG